MSSPYNDLPDSAFWRAAVADKEFGAIEGLWKPKFSLNPKQKYITAGSCFSQRIGGALLANNFSWMDAEPAPGSMTEDVKAAYNYGIFSFRTGNIYTAALLR